MIVFDLECSAGHGFEGWFASSEAYERQHGRALLECPMCGSTSVTRRLSAPRLNLGASERSRGPHGKGHDTADGEPYDKRHDNAHDRAHEGAHEHPPRAARQPDDPAARHGVALSPDANEHAKLVAAQTAFYQHLRQMLERSHDVGDQFAEEARRIHYKETPERQIHGSATREETIELIEEGIPVLPVPFTVRRKDELN